MVRKRTLHVLAIPSGLVEENTIHLFLSYIKRTKHVDLSFYRESFILRRLQARFHAMGVKNVFEYISLLNKEEREWTNFLDNLGINVSEFFRDPEVFQMFQKVCIPKLFESFHDKPIKCWSCGCAYGEEPYSLAILFKDFLNTKHSNRKIHILATDIDESALIRAKQGEYELRSLKNVPKITLKQHFIQTSSGKFKVKDEIQQMVVFKKGNILHDEPPPKIDVLFFRNVRIYFSEKKTEEVFSHITSALREGGYLVLGKVEHLSDGFTQLFTPIDLVQRIYVKNLCA